MNIATIFACAYVSVVAGAMAAQGNEVPMSGSAESGSSEFVREQSSSGDAISTDTRNHCDRLAADPKDKDKPADVAGVDKPSAEAVEACAAAVTADPQNARLNYQAGRAYRKSQDFAKAFYYFDRANSLGSLRAAVAVADAYMSGSGVAKDEGKALDLLKRAASGGDVSAVLQLGKYYSKGPSKNLDLALSWLSSAEDGEVFIALGDLYVSEIRNDAIALKWYRKAADLKKPVAYKRLGWAYFNGRGVPADVTQAVEWDKLAWEEFPDVATNIASSYSRLGNTPEAVAWLERGIARGDAPSAYVLADTYRSCTCVERDHGKALELYKKAVDLGHVDSLLNLGRMYRDGDGVEKNIPLAIEYFGKAIERGQKDGNFWLATSYRDLGDHSRAIETFKKAAEAGDSTAMYVLAGYYRDGNGIKQSYTEALAWFKKAAEAGDSDAMNWVGRFYAAGWSVKQNYVEAGRWYEKAGAAGQGWGNSNLAIFFSRGWGVKKDVALAVDLQETAMKQSTEVCAEFKKSWSNWTPEFLRAFQSRLAQGYNYKGAIDGRLGSGSMAAIEAICARQG